MMLADVVRRMRLSGENELHRPAAGIQDPGQPLRVVKDKLWPFVAGEPACEPNRQRLRLEQRARGDDARRADVFYRPALARTVADEREQIPSQRLANGPELFVGNAEDAVPEGRIVVTLEPVRAEVGAEQVHEIGGDPGGH